MLALNAQQRNERRRGIPQVKQRVVTDVRGCVLMEASRG
jgi:hypothetical protein